MKKFTVFLCSLFLVLGLAANAGAVTLTWNQFQPDMLVENSYPFYISAAHFRTERPRLLLTGLTTLTKDDNVYIISYVGGS